MAPETAYHANRPVTSAPVPAGTGVPLLSLVLCGALRMRCEGEEPVAPSRDGD